MISVSVVIPVFQSADTIGEAIESVLNQTFQDFEIIVVDDGSTDSLDKAIQPFIDKIILLKQENRGAAAARNTGVQHSSGEFIAFLDADDTWLPEKLALQLPLFDDQDVGVVFGNVQFYYRKVLQKKTYFNLNKPERGFVFEPLFANDFVPFLSVLVRRKLVEEIGFFDESIRNVEDYDFLLRLAKICKFEYVDAPVAIYQLSEKQISKNFVQAATALLSLKEQCYHLNKTALQNVNPKILERGLFNKYLKLTLCYIREEQIGDAKRTLNTYCHLRGVSIVYLAFLCLLCLPGPLRQVTVHLWDNVYQKPNLGYY